MKTLTLDFGTHTGWALLDGSQIVASGTLHLASDEELETQRREGTERTRDVRFVRMLAFLQKMIPLGVERVVYEDVTFAGTPMQTQLWASLRAAIWAATTTASFDIYCVPVTTLKVYATGNTRADKSEMAKALVAVDPAHYTLNAGLVVIRTGGRPADDNEVDAIWLGRFTLAADLGEVEFLTAYQRKSRIREKRRESRRAAKAARKARKAAELAEAKAKKLRLLAALKTVGPCCGVPRQLAPRARAICSKCGKSVKLSTSHCSSSADLPQPAIIGSVAS